MSAVDDAAEDVAAELIDAEGMFETHAGQRDAGAHLGQAVGCPKGPRHGDQQMDQQNPGPDLEAARRAAPATRCAARRRIGR